MRTKKSPAHIVLTKHFRNTLEKYKFYLQVMPWQSHIDKEVVLDAQRDAITSLSLLRSVQWNKRERTFVLENVEKLLARELPKIKEFEKDAVKKDLLSPYHSLVDRGFNRMVNDIARE